MAAEKKQSKNSDSQVKRLQMQNERLIEKLREMGVINENLQAENRLLQKENKILSEFAEKSAAEVTKTDMQHSDELQTVLDAIKGLSKRIDTVEGKKA